MSVDSIQALTSTTTNQTDDCAKMGDQEWRDFYAVFTVSLCSLVVKEIQLLCHLTSYWFQIENRDSVKPFEANP